MTNELNVVLSNRGAEYGSFSEIARIVQRLTEQLDNARCDAVHREAIHMICHKLARIAAGNPNNRDSWLDIAGYAQLVVTHLDGGKIREDLVQPD